MTINLVIILMFALNNIHGYLDGGSSSMLLQLILGGAAGAAAVIKIYWYKIKSFFSKKRDK